MQRTRPSAQPPEDSNKLAALAREALDAFQADNADSYKELVAAFAGKSADLVLFGHGRFHVSVSEDRVDIQPDMLRGSGATGRGATTPETILAILEGRMTPLEAFFKGDLVARADSPDLHQTYDYFVRFSDAALRSKRLQNVLAKFREAVSDSGSNSDKP
jgi:hypothetical protein